MEEPPMPSIMGVGPGGGVSSKGKGRLGEAVVDLTRPSAFQPNSGARKLVIKNLRPPNPAREAKVAQYYQQQEGELVLALDAILAGRTPATPFERLFRAVEDLCRRGDAERVYRALKERIENHVYNQIMPRIQNEGGNSTFLTLQSIQAHWSRFNSQMVCGKDVTQMLSLLTCFPRRSLSVPCSATSIRRTSCARNLIRSTR